MRVLLFTRRRVSSENQAFVRSLVTDAEVTSISDERWIARSHWWHAKEFASGPGATESFVSDVLSDGDALEDVISRCRLLRHLPRHDAERRVKEAIVRWSAVLDKVRPDLVLTLPVDSYIVDTLMRVSAKRGIPAASFVGSPFKGRIRFTRYGELLGKLSGSAELDQTIDREYRALTATDFRPEWLCGAQMRPYAVAARRLLVDTLKPPSFALYRFLANDHESFSFPGLRYVTKRMFATPSRYRAALEWEARASDKLPEKFCFLPLQFYPETTSDYWIRNRLLHSHEAAVLRFVDVASKEMPVVIKEHPAVYGRRPSEFLRRLLAAKNVTIAPLRASASALVQMAALVVGNGSGTTAFQARLIGRPVLFFGDPFYDRGPAVAVLEALDSDAIRTGVSNALKRAEKFEPFEAKQALAHYVSATAEGSLAAFKPFLEKTVGALRPAFANPETRQLLSSAIQQIESQGLCGETSALRSRIS